MRTTKKQIHVAFKNFCEIAGERVATSYHDVGSLRLDYIACYGGWNIERIVNDAGGITNPFGMYRLSNGDMFEFLCGMRKYTDALPMQCIN